MNVREELNQLQQENEQLKRDKQNMLKVIEQMRMTSNRLIDRYISGITGKEQGRVN